MLSFDEAWSKLLAMAPTLAAERVGLDDAPGRVLAVDVTSPVDLPGFDYSAMDGYALRADDLGVDGPWQLPIAGESKTGLVPAPLRPGSTCRIFTGAEIPAGADTVVMQENVEAGAGVARFASRPTAGSHIRRRGEDLAKGAVALASGTRLGPSHVALAAAVDRAWLSVVRRPVVTVLGTGDELRPPGGTPVPGTIPESNGAALRAMARGAGAIARVAPGVRDDAAATLQAIEAALIATDVLVTVGGVSVGTHDLVRPALEAAGVALDFWKVAIKPGKPLAVGRRGHAFVLGLPGNPASAMLTFALFGLPLLRAMQGDKRPMARRVPALLGSPVRREPGRTEFLRACADWKDGSLVATPLSNQASGAVTSMAEANALVVVAREKGTLDAGAPVEILWLHELGA
jgi:molybdopterin molybdotransferase